MCYKNDLVQNSKDKKKMFPKAKVATVNIFGQKQQAMYPGKFTWESSR